MSNPAWEEERDFANRPLPKLSPEEKAATEDLVKGFERRIAEMTEEERAAWRALSANAVRWRELSRAALFNNDFAGYIDGEET